MGSSVCRWRTIRNWRNGANVLLFPGHTLCSVTYLMVSGLCATILYSCQIWVRREPIFLEVMRDSSGRAFKGFATTNDTRLFTGHDYPPNSREARWESTVAAQKARNQHLKGQDETKFVKSRMEWIEAFRCLF